MGTRTPLHRAPAGVAGPCRSLFLLIALGALLLPGVAGAQLFDFDNAPYRAPLPIDLTVGDLTAHFSGTGDGFSIQAANTMGFTPAGFAGLCIYPDGVFGGDLLIDFSRPLSDFSILYAPQELGCDDSAIMRVTAYMDATLVGTATTTAPAPGTWPTGTLAYSSPLGFNHVVVHYDHRPACTDYGPIFMADNMNVTTLAAVPWIEPGAMRVTVTPNPFRASTTIRLELPRAGRLTVSIHDVAGRAVRTLAAAASFPAGVRSIEWDGMDDAGHPAGSGLYLCRVATDAGVRIKRMILRH